VTLRLLGYCGSVARLVQIQPVPVFRIITNRSSHILATHTSSSYIPTREAYTSRSKTTLLLVLIICTAVVALDVLLVKRAQPSTSRTTTSRGQDGLSTHVCLPITHSFVDILDHSLPSARMYIHLFFMDLANSSDGSETCWLELSTGRPMLPRLCLGPAEVSSSRKTHLTGKFHV
jgi:hypothetical protein